MAYTKASAETFNLGNLMRMEYKMKKESLLWKEGLHFRGVLGENQLF